MQSETALFTQLGTKAALLDAWRVIRKKGKAGGIDRVSVDYYEKRFDRNLDALLENLLNGQYVPEPYERINIKKDNKPGEFRPLSLPTVNDKIVQQALRNLLEPIFNPLFLDVSYAYRAGKGAAKAIGRIAHIISSQKSVYAVCADIDNYFDTLDHQILLTGLTKTVDEPEIAKLVRLWLKIGAVNPKGSYEDTPFGIAQGGVISPLLSNIYLHPFDVYMTEKGSDYVRYADNFILLAPNRAGIEEAFKASHYFLREVLKLRLNKQKQRFKRVDQGFGFMGIFFKRQRKFIERGRILRMRSRLRYLVRSKLWHQPRAFFRKMEEITVGFNAYYGKILNPESAYDQFNTYLRQSVAETLVYHYRKERKKLHKTAVKALLAPIRLFGHPDAATRDQWVLRTADECLNRFRKLEAAEKSATDDKAEQNTKGVSKAIKAADTAVRKQKTKYRKLESVSREVVVKTFGTFIGKNYRNLVVKKRGRKIFDFPLQKLETVNIVTRGVTLSSDIIWYCAKNRIPIFFSDSLGMPMAVLQNPAYGSATLGLLQLQLLQDGHGAIELAREFVQGKIRNQINLLKYYRRHRSRKSVYGSALKQELRGFKKGLRKIKKVRFGQGGYGRARNRLMGYEAEAARRYWQMVKILLADDIPDYPGRERRGARDLVNSLLNYGYGFLYRQVWREAVHAGLNPKIGFLHAPQGEKPVLVFDLVEEFRPQAVDRVVFSMITRNERLRLKKKSGLIADASREKLLQALLERQGTAMRYRGGKMLLKNIIKQQVHDLCRHLKGEHDYRYFIGYY